MSRYRKIEVRTWSDEKFRSLSPMQPSGQSLWFFLLTGPHTGPIPGLFRAGRASMAEELGWSLEAFDKAFQEVSDLGMAKADFKSRLVWLPNAVKHNKPESPNVVRGWMSELDLLPECDLKRDALADIEASLMLIGMAYIEAFNGVPPSVRVKSNQPQTKPSAKPSDKPLEKASSEPSVEAMPNQEQEQEQENISTNVLVLTAGESAPAIPDCPFDAILAAYHESLPVCPAVKVLNESRKKHIRARWRERAAAGKYVDQAGGIAYFRRLFGYAAQSKFLTGQVNGRDRSPFFADLEFLMQPSSFARLIEGKYHQQEAA